ncbi:hypothetical protein O181_056196 [Austropuccinia psidii MF-1]|uniref:Uncharacterized protein n=1 Tax=Austropuccinia psidii MF-1 TaxID=1389203 RepID=A0A9Q3E5V4_9BASI|nr:hypothetical protein [Austropuccinia psidii MF-1]
MTSCNHQTSSNGVFPQDKGNLDPDQWAEACRNKDWCIYGIIYHHAPFFLRNQMVMASGPHYVIPNQVPKSITPFQRTPSVIKSCNTWWLSEDHSRTPIKWPFGCWLFHLNSIPPREDWPRIHQA